MSAQVDDFSKADEIDSNDLYDTVKTLWTSGTFTNVTRKGYAVTSNTLNTNWPIATTASTTWPGTYNPIYNTSGTTIFCVECAFYEERDAVPGPYLVGGNSLCYRHAEGRMHVIEETP